MTRGERLVKVTMSESSAKAVLQAIQEDADPSKWGHDQWIRTDAIIELSEALGIEPAHPIQSTTHPKGNT